MTFCAAGAGDEGAGVGSGAATTGGGGAGGGGAETVGAGVSTFGEQAARNPAPTNGMISMKRRRVDGLDMTNSFEVRGGVMVRRFKFPGGTTGAPEDLAIALVQVSVRRRTTESLPKFCWNVPLTQLSVKYAKPLWKLLFLQLVSSLSLEIENTIKITGHKTLTWCISA